MLGLNPDSGILNRYQLKYFTHLLRYDELYQGFFAVARRHR